MSDVNILIGLPSPRDLENVRSAVDTIPCDQYWVKYEPEGTAYPKIRDFFLSNPLYTHLAICPDDLVMNLPSFNRLVEDVKSLPRDVITGVCNINEDEMYAGMINVMRHLVTPYRTKRRYSWIKLSERDESAPLVPVLFAGFAFTIIPRAVVEGVPFRTDAEINGLNGRSIGASADVMFSWDCHKSGVRFFADVFATFHHSSRFNRELLVGVKEPRVEFVPSKVKPLIQG